MQHCLYIFLQRNRENDIPHIYNTMSYLLKTSEKIALLLFPEGTDLSATNIAKSNAYAAKNNLPEYKYVLHPKSTGFFVSLQAMRHHGGCVHDISVAYKDRIEGERPNEKALMLGLSCVFILYYFYNICYFDWILCDFDIYIRSVSY
jgi:lysocardiolipin and lysophospholipid acyltransferase